MINLKIIEKYFVVGNKIASKIFCALLILLLSSFENNRFWCIDLDCCHLPMKNSFFFNLSLLLYALNEKFGITLIGYYKSAIKICARKILVNCGKSEWNLNDQEMYRNHNVCRLKLLFYVCNFPFIDIELANSTNKLYILFYQGSLFQIVNAIYSSFFSDFFISLLISLFVSSKI